MPRTFLTAEWLKLIMANYAVPQEALQPHLPVGTEFDEYEGQTYVSLVGFLFQNTRLKSIRVPFHSTFVEVNLRFYVKHVTANGELRWGVVFIREFAPRRALTLVANTFYGENYATLPLRHQWAETNDHRSVAYSWKHKSRWHRLSVEASPDAQPIQVGSAEEFFTEHYWGYTRRGTWSSEYAVMHPRWQVYPVQQYVVDVDFKELYGEAFGALTNHAPDSILLAEGSEVEVLTGERIHAVEATTLV
jgi:uncharacterized protein YqjF (DUF2071 family)